jgi:hypothetical protein
MALLAKRGEKALEDAAFLKMHKAKSTIHPTRVVFLRGKGPGFTGALFYFPQKDKNGAPTISPDEKEIDFYFQIERFELMTFFQPQKMSDAQG